MSPPTYSSRTARHGRSLTTSVLAALAVLAGGCARTDRSPPNVVLITLDTVRADHLEPYGSTVTRTPNVARLATEGTLFENAAAPMPLTRPSHSTLFTSRHPRRHGVTDNALSLPESELTVAEVFRSAGYRTGAFLGARIVGRPSGVPQGFERVVAPARHIETPAARVVEQAVRWLRSIGTDEPWLLWIHLFDAHLPYAPPEYFVPPPGPESPPLSAVTWRRLRNVARNHGGTLDAHTLARARALYAGEVDSVDAALGALLLELDERGLTDRTLTVLTADHGECFENGFFFRHGGCLYEGAVHVPLIFRFPGHVAAGARREPQVRHEDVAPTLLTLAGLPIPESFEGRPLFDRDGAPEPLPEDRIALVQHPVSAERTGTARRDAWEGIETVAGVAMRPSPQGVQQFALRDGRWKYIATTDGVEELYDLAADPAEARNVAAEERDVVRRYRALLRRRLDELPLTVLEPEALTPEMRKELEALGYL